MLEGAALLLGPDALGALPDGALAACEAALVAGAAQLNGAGGGAGSATAAALTVWERLERTYERMGGAAGAELRSALLLHS